MSRRLAAALASIAAIAVGGCGLGAGDAPTGSRLVVTRDFGARVLLDTDSPKVSGEETILRMLDRNADVQTRYGGKFVQEVDGVGGGTRDGRAVDWLFYINGSQSDEGAASVKLQDGDSVWWDNHSWQITTAEAVVGQFPEPFLHGPRSKRLPVRVECSAPSGPACRTVQQRLIAQDVPAFRARLAAQLEQETLRIVVGPYRELRGDRAAGALARGPRSSGVFARPNAGATRIELLDAAGEATQSIGAGGGLVAAIQPAEVDPAEELLPVWVVTGVDDAGVLAAARAVDEGVLARKFALAVTADGRGVGLPTAGAR